MLTHPLRILALAALSALLMACAPGVARPERDAPMPPAMPSATPPAMPVSTPGMPQFAPAALVNEASTLTQRFVGTLLPTLQAAMDNGGPLNAIAVCAVEAPKIAQQLSEESGWEVGRVSLKARNSSTAMPDNWERQVLNTFDQRQRFGESPATLNVAEVVNGTFRYMQAQAAAPLCLTCHGSEVSGEVLSAIRRQYPDDLAIGYKAGEIRGAISLSKPL